LTIYIAEPANIN